MIEENRPISNLTNLFPLTSQRNYEFKTENINNISNSFLEELSNKMNEKIGDEGRVIIRKSGTEPLIRVMVETDTKNIGETLIDEIKLSLNHST